MAGVARSTVYLIFGSRAGLFDAVARDLLDRGGFDRIVRAVGHPDARETCAAGSAAPPTCSPPTATCSAR